MKNFKQINIFKIIFTLFFVVQFILPTLVFSEDWEEARGMVQSGKELEKKGQFSKATDVYKKATSQFPEYPDGYIQLGFGLQVLKKFDFAIDAYQKGLNLSPYHRFAPEAYYNMSFSADKMGQGSEAIAYLKKSLQAYTDRNDYSGVFKAGSYLEVLSNKYPKAKNN
jgi:tetratricopeptide (TPR) repeat protein